MPRGINAYDEGRIQGRNVANANSSNIVSPGIVTDGLVLHLDAGNYNSYPIAGTTWYDLSDRKNNGTLTNGPTYVRDGGGSISFDNQANNYCNFGDVLDLGTNDLTILFWIYVPNSFPAVLQGICGKTRAANSVYRYATLIEGSTNRFWALMQGGSLGSSVNALTTAALVVNTWQMCTAVFKRKDSIELYINQNKEALTATASISAFDGQDFQSSNPFRIASYTASDGTSPTFFAKAYMPINLVYFRALSQTEISQNFNATRARFNV